MPPSDNSQSALLQNSNNNNVSIYKFLNFTISRKENPREEFLGVRKLLSKERVSQAENGVYQQLAFKLGVLFEEKLPKTTTLIRTYGTRASEVSQIPEVNPRGSKKDGLFESKVGADGTSIWAAATCGDAAIAVHLLACMLARIWKDDKATSLWFQIVKERQKEIEESESPNLFVRMAAQQPISDEELRRELAHWDASARAWLRRADEAKAWQQKQLQEIIDDVTIDVNKTMDTYESVIQAWSIAMTTVDKLIRGEPHNVTNGAVLLGLSAWHLYPTMNVLSRGREPILLEDQLVHHGGILTIGVQEREAGDISGVRWSLPLSYLQFYGEPVVSIGSVSQTKRISMSDLLQAVLGCVLKDWGYSNLSTAAPILRILSEMWLYLSRAIKSLEQNIGTSTQSSAYSEEPAFISIESEQSRQDRKIHAKLKEVTEISPRWPVLLGRAAHEFSISQGVERQYYESLQRLGMRQENFLPRPAHESRAFEFLRTNVLSLLCKSQGQRVALLRNFSQLLGWSNEQIIRYQIRRNEEGEDFDVIAKYVSCGLTTATFSQNNDQEESRGRLQRWLGVDQKTPLDWADRNSVLDAWLKAGERLFETNENYESEIQQVSALLKTGQGFGFTWFEPPWLPSPDSSRPSALFHILYGDPYDAALYFTGSYPKNVNIDQETAWASTIELAFKSDAIDASMLLRYFDALFPSEDLGYRRSIQGLCAAAQLYKSLPGATVSIEVVSQPLHYAKWIDGGLLVEAQRNRGTTSHENRGEKRSSTSHEDLEGKRPRLSYWNRREGYIASEIFESDEIFDSEFLLFGPSIPQPPPGTLSLAQEHWVETDWEVPGLQGGMNSGPLENQLLPEAVEETWGQWRALEMDRSSAFACVVFFESGVHNLVPENLKSVMAVASGDLIYVSASLLCDPDVVCKDSDIRKIIGNIGLPGIALLVPPTNPMVRTPDLSKFRLVKHENFDGELADKFPKTQVNLSFTGYEERINIGSHGARDAVIYFLEAIVQVYDADTWLADLDVLSALDSPLLNRCGCRCSASLSSHRQNHTNIANFTPAQIHDSDTEELGEPVDTTEALNKSETLPELISIDNWEEFLQRPSNKASIVRAHGNWISRLAATSLSIQQRWPAFVLSKSVCWLCVERVLIKKGSVLIS
jgi:hypothetical protein